LGSPLTATALFPETPTRRPHPVPQKRHGVLLHLIESDGRSVGFQPAKRIPGNMVEAAMAALFKAIDLIKSLLVIVIHHSFY
jgi:hypothetical protein